MLFFPNAKINLGLNVLRKRNDGFHDIETMFVPVPHLQDVVEIVFSDSFEDHILNRPFEDTLCRRAYELLAADFDIPKVHINIFKNIPEGAGLGGGSADAAFTLMGLNDLCSLNLSEERLAQYASMIGSDCPFFIYNRPMLASGRGEILTPYPLSLEGYRIEIFPQNVFVSTKEAYAGVSPRVPEKSLREVLELPVEKWKETLFNDFEPSVFAAHKQLAAAKERLYDGGAVYAAMTGSGSALFALFRDDD